jgi:SAM-dependent methyltransferase
MTMDHCPLCDGSEFTVFVERDGVPVHQNVTCASAQAARAVTRGDLRLACCKTCGFVTNLAFRSALLQYGEGYENDQTNSAAFDAHMGDRIRALVSFGIRGKEVVEVGCGQGHFLRRLCEAGDNRGIGFDPAYVGPDSVDAGRVTFERKFYTTGALDRSPDLVVCRHVIEHVPQPLELLANVRSALGADKPTLLAFETPAVDWILEGTVVQDFFYEHCSYFTASSLRLAFERAGFANYNSQLVFGGQYLWAMAQHRVGGGGPVAMPQPTATLRAAQRYQDRLQARVSTLASGVGKLAKAGQVAVWGAGAKGVTFLNLIDPNASLVAVAIDINPKKQGRFIAGTGHAIVRPAEALRHHVESVVVMNPNYIDEIRCQLADVGYAGRVYAEGDL